MKEGKPVICTLTPGERRRRGTGWRSALQHAVTSVKRCASGYVITFNADDDKFAEIEQLVAAERACCEWMTLDLQRNGEETTLTMTADSRLGTAAIGQMLAGLV